MPRNYWFHCADPECDYREMRYRNVKVCPVCGGYLIREEPPSPVYLGVPHPYPEDKPTRGRYLTWVVNKSTKPREFWTLTWYDNSTRFGASDKQVTLWLPMPPNMSTRKGE